MPKHFRPKLLNTGLRSVRLRAINACAVSYDLHARAVNFGNLPCARIVPMGMKIRIQVPDAEAEVHHEDTVTLVSFEDFDEEKTEETPMDGRPTLQMHPLLLEHLAESSVDDDHDIHDMFAVHNAPTKLGIAPTRDPGPHRPRTGTVHGDERPRTTTLHGDERGRVDTGEFDERDVLDPKGRRG